MRVRTKHLFVLAAKVFFPLCTDKVRMLEELPLTLISSSHVVLFVSLSLCKLVLTAG